MITMFGMRKWVVAGLVALAVGAGAYLLSQPKKGTVEWHKKEYFSTLEQKYGQRLIDRARRSTYQRTGWRWLLSTQTVNERVKLQAKIDAHREALVRSGYIVERIFTVNDPIAFRATFADRLATNRTRSGVVWATETRPFLTCIINVSHDGSVVVTGPRDDIGLFLQRVVGKGDEPKR